VCASGIVLYGNGLAVSPVEIKFDVEIVAKGEVLSQDFWGYGDKWQLTKHGLDKIANAVGMIWEDSRLVEYRTDENGRAVYIKHQVAWQRPTTTGIPQRGISTGEYSYYEDLSRLKHKNDVVINGKVVAQKGSPIIEQIEKRRNYSGALAETNAKVRALNESLAELPKSFTKEDIQKKLIVFRPIVDVVGIANQSPELLQIYHAKILGVADMIYQPIQNNNILVDSRKLNLVNETPQSLPATQPIEKSNNQSNSQSDTQSDSELDKEIEQLIKITNYKGKGLNVWRDFDLETKKEFQKFLKEQETKQQEIKK